MSGLRFRLRAAAGRSAAALALLLAALLPAVAPAPAAAATARSLAGRIVVDGFFTEYAGDEAVFGKNPGSGADEEPTFDSAWGPDNDFNQIHITWDKDSLYVSAEGVIWGNNMIVLFDCIPDRGMTTMRQLNSWSRNFTFSDDFAPDLFLATWDGNATPRLLIHRDSQDNKQVRDEQVGTLFRASATFSTNLRGRCMEYAIPWDTFFLGSEGYGTTKTFVPSLGDTVHLFPPGTVIKIAGVITAGGDNTGGPDSAPDNTRGHVSDGSQDVIIDNYATLELDRLDDSGLGAGGPDGVADWNVSPASRVGFKFTPPLVAVRLEIGDVYFDRPVFAPDKGEVLHLTYRVDPAVNPNDPLSASRTVNLSANVFNADGKFVRTLYLNQTRAVFDPADPYDPHIPTDPLDQWDGKDEEGRIVPAGVYIVRVVAEPNIGRVTKAVVVVR